MWWNKEAVDVWFALAIELARSNDEDVRRLLAFARGRRRVWLVVTVDGGLAVM